MFTLLKSESIPLTRDLAERFQAMEASPTERVLNPKRVQYLREQAEAKPSRLVNFHWSTAKLGGHIMRMNGNHSSKMLCELDGVFPTGLYVHRDDYEVDTDEGLALLFRQFDNRKSARGLVDISGAYQNLYPALRDVPRDIGKLGVEGYSWYCRYISKIPVPGGDDAYQMFNDPEVQKVLLWLKDILGLKTPEMKRAPIVAAMYQTFILSEGAARNFWHDVSRGGLEFDDTAPSTVLDKWLKDVKEGEFEQKVGAGGFYQGCIHAWNAFREDRQIKSIRFDTKKGFFTPIE